MPIGEENLVSDNVNHPAHYQSQSGIECIDAIMAMTGDMVDGDEAFLAGTIMKYIWRYQNKDNPIQDLEKAQWYLNKLITVLKSKQEGPNDY